jgi:LPXTG-motif cell wall-anchored protein
VPALQGEREGEMNTALVDMVRSGIEKGVEMPWQYQAGLAAAGLLAGLVGAVVGWRRKKKTKPKG